jgi:hypothetical protein
MMIFFEMIIEKQKKRMNYFLCIIVTTYLINKKFD